jgi:hypothetical protein
VKEVERRLRLVGAHRGPAECLFRFGHGSTPAPSLPAHTNTASGIGSTEVRRS